MKLVMLEAVAVDTQLGIDHDVAIRNHLLVVGEDFRIAFSPRRWLASSRPKLPELHLPSLLPINWGLVPDANATGAQ